MKQFSWWVPKVVMYTTMHTFPHSQSAAPQSVCQLTFNTAQGSLMTCLKAMHLTFYGLIAWHSIHARYEDRPLAWKLPKHTFWNICINSTITVCHPLLCHTCCLNAQEQDGKFARVMMSVTAYNLPPNFHFVYIVLIVVYQLPFSTPHILHSWLAVCDHKWEQNLNQRCIV